MLRDRVEFFQVTETINDFGNTVSAWASQGKRWCRVLEKRGQEKLDAGAVQDYASAVIRVRRDSLTADATPKYWLAANGKDWNILSITAPDNLGRWLDFLVVERDRPGA